MGRTHPLEYLSAPQAVEWLARQRGETARLLPTQPESYTPRETAKLLGVSLAAVREAVKRHGLQATGLGKKRRFPKTTVQALLDRQGQGARAQTRNYYRTH